MKRIVHPAGRAAAILAFLVAAAATLGAQTAQLKEISTQRDGSKLVAQILVAGTFTSEVSILNFPRRLVVDFTPVSRIAVAPYTLVDDLGVLDIRTGQFKPMTARVVFDLGDKPPAYTVAPVTGGVRVTFWYEGGEEPFAQPPDREAAKPEAAKPIEREPVRKEAPAPEPKLPAGPRRQNFFAAARVGFSSLLKSQILASSEFSLYGETGTLSETYDFKSGPVFDFSVGKYFHRLKVGAAVTFWSLKEEAAFLTSLPHPFQADSPREKSFAFEPIKSSALNFYGYLEFAFFDSPAFSVWAGVLAGLSKSKFLTLDNYDFSERSPYTAADVTIENITSFEDAFSELMFGGLLTFEYRFNERLSLVLDTKMIYANPRVLNLGIRTNLLQFQPILGLQFNF